MTFEGRAPLGGYIQIFPGHPYSEAGFTVTVTTTNSAVFDSQQGSRLIGDPTSFFDFGPGNRLNLARTGGGAFNLDSLQIGPSNIGRPEINAARREAFEELGIVSDRMELLEAVHKPNYVDSYSGITIFLFRVLTYTGIIANREPEKHSCLTFITPSQIPRLGRISFPTQFVSNSLGEQTWSAAWPSAYSVRGGSLGQSGIRRVALKT